jgi:hypothetical protein
LDPIQEALARAGFERAPSTLRTAWRRDQNGRICKVGLIRQSKTRYAGEIRVRQPLGYRLRIDLDTAVGTRLFFVRESITAWAPVAWVYRLRKQVVIAQLPPALEGFHVVARDAPWAERLLQEAEAVEAAGALLHEHATATLAGSVYFGPGSLHYASPILQIHDLGPDQTLLAIDRLDTIAAAAERIESPRSAVKLSRLERLSKDHPYVAAFVILGAILFGLLLVVGLMLGLATLALG